MSKNKKPSIPVWTPEPVDSTDEMLKCNLHSYVNTSIIILLCLFNLIFFSTHWDNTMSMQQNKVIERTDQITFTIKHQQAASWASYPIPELLTIQSYTLCCLHKTAIKSTMDCNFHSILEHDAETNTVILKMYSGKDVLENLLCHL